MPYMNLCRTPFNDTFGFVLIEDASKPKCETRTLDQRLVTKHTGRVGLPWLSVAFALSHVLSNDGRVCAVFPVYLAGTRAFFLVVGKLHSIKLRMFVDDSSPAVNADYRNNSTFIRECINLFCPRVQSVLVGDDQQCRELLISDIPTLKCCIFQSVHQVSSGIHAEAGGKLPGHCRKCCAHRIPLKVKTGSRCGGPSHIPPGRKLLPR